MYVGYMYTNGQLHGLGTNSDIKTTIDNWYASNLADEAEYLEGVQASVEIELLIQQVVEPE